MRAVSGHGVDELRAAPTPPLDQADVLPRRLTHSARTSRSSPWRSGAYSFAARVLPAVRKRFSPQRCGLKARCKHHDRNEGDVAPRSSQLIEHADQASFNLQNPDTIRLIDGYEIQDAIFQSYGNESIEDTAIIVWANKRANQYNEQIRTRIMGKEGDISSGDYVMVVKNNYYWLDDTSEAGFIANGDTCQILSIRNRVELYGFKFAEATVKLVDYPKQQAFDVVLLLDTLTVMHQHLPMKMD